ncbi:hypothetical protein SAMN05192561_11219 [Halopenitus malekzadehii]|uniref:Uncharacterized protein n=1 Tax=Halopenitus malekzadehii TaxID=1267564 RepID=A0A1H6JLH2_9EURY|nr:hypothetical protein [Halopenitus malekzadehii]SEH60603.1 hypothetical protein SAMN05192561_11219 [Halopenitus malekzadehii]
MGYDYTCDECGEPGEHPGLLGSFNKRTWTTTPFGERLQALGYELGDTITLCPECTHRLLR